MSFPEKVTVVMSVDYRGTQITKQVCATGNETPAVLVNRAIESVTKKIQIMVQSEQGQP